MRLTCPNCGAQYEVDGSMIPPEGRDVQCSNCGRTWFQEPEGAPLRLSDPVPEPVENPGPSIEEQVAELTHPEPDAEASADVEADGAPQDEPVVEATFIEDADAAQDDATHDSADDDTDEVAEAFEDDVEDEPAPEETPDDTPLPRKPSDQLDKDRLSILIEEATRESDARRAEAGGLETQPDLGLDNGGKADEVGSAVSAHIARMRSESAASTTDVEDDAEATLAGSRSDLLPDIEEINSSLRPANEHSEVQEHVDPAVTEKQQRKGFRMGFSLILLLVALLIMAYVFAPQLAEQVPQAEPALAAYVDLANGARAMIDQLLDAAVRAMSGGDTE